MSKKKLYLTPVGEKCLLAIGREEGHTAEYYGLPAKCFSKLSYLNLIVLRLPFPGADPDIVRPRWFLTNEGSFLFKQLARGKTFNPRLETPTQKGGAPCND